MTVPPPMRGGVVTISASSESCDTSSLQMCPFSALAMGVFADITLFDADKVDELRNRHVEEMKTYATSDSRYKWYAWPDRDSVMALKGPYKLRLYAIVDLSELPTQGSATEMFHPDIWKCALGSCLQRL